MNINTQSVIKAGGAAALIGLVLGVLSVIPVLNCLVAPLLCIGSFLLPLGAGLGYGYWTPGKEEMTESAIGGALAGGFGGFVYGLVTGLASMVTNSGTAALLEGSDIGTAATGGFVGLLISLCIPIIGGLFFGAIGGVLWPVIQGDRT